MKGDGHAQIAQLLADPLRIGIQSLAADYFVTYSNDFSSEFHVEALQVGVGPFRACRQCMRFESKRANMPGQVFWVP